MPASGQNSSPAESRSGDGFPRKDLGLCQKNARENGPLIVFSDESGLREKLSFRSTRGRKGKTPVVVHSFSWAKRSIMGGLFYRRDGTSAKMTFEIVEDAFDLSGILR